jgi:hypothetical protein
VAPVVDELVLRHALPCGGRPLDAMSIYPNGFHMYADEMARQVEASHFFSCVMTCTSA